VNTSSIRKARRGVDFKLPCPPLYL
jgi:hypothetical protein